ncbi:MAG TPA: IS110 family transposase [Actinomycetota bacterium]
MREQGQARTIGMEGSLSYGASVAPTLLESGEDVREVAPTLTHLERRRRSKGKSDPVDAVAIARVVAADQTLPSARRTALLADLKLLVDYHDQLVRARTQVANRVHANLVVIRPGYEQVVPNLRASRHVARARSLLSRDRSVQAELLRRRLQEIVRLEAEIAETDRRIVDKLEEADTTLTQIPGVGPFIAAKILGEVGEISRIRSKASFAMLSGTAPLVASSGQTHRHRLNRRGNRQLNWALHYVALVQARTTPEAKAYLARLREGGKSHKEAMRCLKRHLSNVVYRHLLVDARRLEQAA